ncbi:MAG: collagen binding domain-containing protein [Planctomycetota bacterium]
MRRAPLLLLVLLLGALALLAWLGGDDGAVTPRAVAPSVGSAQDASGSDAPLTGRPALRGPPLPEPATEPTEERSVVRYPGSSRGAGCALTVRVRMRDGTPLPNVVVGLLDTSIQARGVLLSGPTDAQGRVRFVGLPAGPVTCQAQLVEATLREDALLGEDSEASVVLESPSSTTYVHGTVRRAGAAVPGRAVVARGRDSEGTVVWALANTDEAGRYQLLLRRGAYRLQVAGAPADAQLAGRGHTWWQPGGRGPWLAGGELDVDGDPAVVERNLEVPPTAIELEVHAPHGTALAEARAFARVIGLAAEGLASLAVDDNGRVTFLDLPFGAVELSVVAQGAAQWTHRVELTQASPTQRVRVDLAAGGSVRAVLKGPAGNVLELATGDPIFAEHLETGLRMPRREARGLVPERAAVFENLPLGRVRIFVEQARTEHGLRLGRLDAPHPAEVDVLPGQADVILDDVRVHTRVTLRAKPPEGRDERWARVEVYDEGGQRMAATNPEAPHWVGFLAPGTYRLSLNDGWTGTWEETVRVGTDDVDQTFEAPR